MMKKARVKPAPRKSSTPFSSDLEAWLNGKQPKTLDSLIRAFGEKSFAVIMMLFMLLPALPIPTAGHVFEVVVMLVALEQVAGLKTLWLPESLSKRVNLGSVARSKVMKKVLKALKWLEDKSSPRAKWIYYLPLTNRVLGLIIFGFSLAAFLSPPFSLLDTLPALGVVLISLGILLEDAVLLFLGFCIGVLGVGLSIFLGAQITHYLKVHLFHKQV
jgi:hypothetical protein